MQLNNIARADEVRVETKSHFLGIDSHENQWPQVPGRVANVKRALAIQLIFQIALVCRIAIDQIAYTVGMKKVVGL